MRIAPRLTAYWLLILALAGITGQALAVDVPPPLDAPQILGRLKQNTAVSLLVRMVDYDPAHPQLKIDRLKNLGAPVEDFTFVADYEELRGRTIADAVRLSGGSLPAGAGVSAIVFPIDKHTIFPASVRGMLQVVQQIDMRRAAQRGYRPAPLDELLTPAERANLAAVDLASWAWDNYRDDFAALAQAFTTLRTKPASAIEHIGHIGTDWCEPGVARLLHPHSPAEKNLVELAFANGTTLKIENLGVRVFLIRNLPISELRGRILIDFEHPEAQHLPEIDLLTAP